MFLLFGKSKHLTKYRTIPTVFVPRLFVPSSTITKPIQHQFNDYKGHVQQRHQEQQQRPGLRFGCRNQVTTETNVDLTNEHKDNGTTDKCNFLFNSGSVNCGQFAEFEESDGCNYKYQYDK